MKIEIILRFFFYFENMGKGALSLTHIRMISWLVDGVKLWIWKNKVVWMASKPVAIFAPSYNT